MKTWRKCSGCGMQIRSESAELCVPCQDNHFIVTAYDFLVGIRVNGPFQNIAEAQDWINRNRSIGTGWQIVPVSTRLRGE